MDNKSDWETDRNVDEYKFEVTRPAPDGKPWEDYGTLYRWDGTKYRAESIGLWYEFATTEGFGPRTEKSKRFRKAVKIADWKTHLGAPEN